MFSSKTSINHREHLPIFFKCKLDLGFNSNEISFKSLRLHLEL